MRTGAHRERPGTGHRRHRRAGHRLPRPARTGPLVEPPARRQGRGRPRRRRHPPHPRGPGDRLPPGPRGQDGQEPAPPGPAQHRPGRGDHPGGRARGHPGRRRLRRGPLAGPARPRGQRALPAAPPVLTTRRPPHGIGDAAHPAPGRARPAPRRDAAGAARLGKGRVAARLPAAPPRRAPAPPAPGLSALARLERAQARTNLRHLLHNLRRSLPDPDRYLEVTQRTLRWRDDAPRWLDVAAFEDALDRADREGQAVGALQEAVELYGGDLLQSGYDEWLLEERERLRRRYLEALERLAELLEAAGEHARAIGHAERLLREDPLREATYRRLMRLHDARGDRARALRAYHACAAALERELNVEPSAATRRAYAALLPQRAGPAGEPAAGRAGPLGRPALVGRAAQRARLTELWRAATAGEARLVLVTGEPGAGKTRLVEELGSWCAHGGAAVAEARSYPAEGALAYGPVVAWLRSDALAGHLGRLEATHRDQLARLLPELGPAVPDPPGDHPGGPPDPSGPPPDREQRRLLFEALSRAVLATPGPLLLVADDLHWADTETLQFLHYLLRAEPQARLLVVATVRPEELDPRHPLDDLRTGLRALDRVAEVEVGRLPAEETAALAERLRRRPLAAAEAGRLFAETEGNPLFVVEAVRAGWSGQGRPPPITPKVQAVIEARLAQLSGPARDLAGVAATIGCEFSTDVLAQASQAGEAALVGGLDELWRRRIVRDRGPDAYDFTHDRIREVAYLGLSPARRRHTHLLVARALERPTPATRRRWPPS